MATKREKIHLDDAAAATALAAFQLAQSITIYLIDAKILAPAVAVAIIRDAATSEEDAMDDMGGRQNAAAAHILSVFGKLIAEKHGLEWPK